jgi:O-methyltransferase
MSKNFAFSNQNLDEALILVKELLAEGNIPKAAKLCRMLSGTYADSEYVRQAKKIISESLRSRFGEFLGGNVTDLNLAQTYLSGFEKKIDIRVDIPIFSSIASSILEEDRTSLYFDRLYTIFQSLFNTSRLAGAIVELGVYRGGSVKFMARVCEALGAPRAIFGLDTFSGLVHVASQDGPTHYDGRFKGPGLQDVSRYLEDSPAVTLIEGDILETLDRVLAEIESVVFVHVDLDLYEPTAFSLPRVARKLVPGGIILLDDYGFVTCRGAKEASDEFLKAGGFRHFHLLTGQCILIKSES